MRDLERRCDFLSGPTTTANTFYVELRRMLNKHWKYMSVGVSEYSSSFQQILQCGMRRIIPADRFQQFMIHHSVNKAQRRRVRREELTPNDWLALIAQRTSAEQIKTLDEMYNSTNGIVFEQYNLHMIDRAKLEGAKWSWEVEDEPEAGIPKLPPPAHSRQPYS
jgi:hypothetical protein